MDGTLEPKKASGERRCPLLALPRDPFRYPYRCRISLPKRQASLSPTAGNSVPQLPGSPQPRLSHAHWDDRGGGSWDDLERVSALLPTQGQRRGLLPAHWWCAMDHGMPTRSLQPSWPTGLGRVLLGSLGGRRKARRESRFGEKLGLRRSATAFWGSTPALRRTYRVPQPGAHLLSVAACLRPPWPDDTVAALAAPGLSRRGERAGAAAGWRDEQSPCRKHCTCRGSHPCAPSRARPGRPGP